MNTHKFFRVLAIAFPLLVNGCTTMKAVQDVGKQASEGNFLLALYLGTIGVTVAAIYDTVTLGGTLSNDDVAAIGGAAINSAAAQKQQKEQIDAQRQRELYRHQQAINASKASSSTGSQSSAHDVGYGHSDSPSGPGICGVDLSCK